MVNQTELDDDIYISVALDDYLELVEIRDFLKLLVDYGLEKWSEFPEALEEFLEEDDTRDDPLDNL